MQHESEICERVYWNLGGVCDARREYGPYCLIGVGKLLIRRRVLPNVLQIQSKDSIEKLRNTGMKIVRATGQNKHNNLE